jgi:hypothetical protein
MGIINDHYKRIPFKARHKRLLKQQLFTATTPGPIVHDFDALLDYVYTHPLAVTGMQQLPLRTLPEINALLHRPIQMGLQRPQQKSYPAIHGLYLVLRASGLTYLDQTRAKPHLCVDEALYAAWKALNPTEQYCALLEAWLLRGYPEIVGERELSFALPENYSKWFYFFQGLPRGGRAYTSIETLLELSSTPGWHNLGLLDLFGCIEILPGVPVAGQGWQIAHLDRTPFGEALLALLAATFFTADDRRSELHKVTPFPPGTLQPALRPFIPQWERLLPLPAEATVRDGVHIFKVALGKNLWRRLALLATSTLDELAQFILHAYTFDSDHLYRFSYQNRYGRLCHINHTYLEEAPWTSEVRVGELPLAVGQTMTFLFDLNDRWEFEVTLEAVDTDPAAAQAPRVLERRGKAPQQCA